MASARTCFRAPQAGSTATQQIGNLHYACRDRLVASASSDFGLWTLDPGLNTPFHPFVILQAMGLVPRRRLGYYYPNDLK